MNCVQCKNWGFFSLQLKVILILRRKKNFIKKEKKIIRKKCFREEEMVQNFYINKRFECIIKRMRKTVKYLVPKKSMDS